MEWISGFYAIFTPYLLDLLKNVCWKFFVTIWNVPNLLAIY